MGRGAFLQRRNDLDARLLVRKFNNIRRTRRRQRHALAKHCYQRAQQDILSPADVVGLWWPGEAQIYEIGEVDVDASQPLSDDGGIRW